MLILELKIISNSVSIPQIRQDYAPHQQDVTRAAVIPFPNELRKIEIETEQKPSSSAKFTINLSI